MQELDRTGNFALNSSQGRLNAHQEASVFAQDLSQVNETETDLNKPLETETTTNFMLQTQSNITGSMENPLNEVVEEKKQTRGRSKKIDQDAELP